MPSQTHEVRSAADWSTARAAKKGIDSAFATLVKQGPGAVLISPDTLFGGSREHIAALAPRHAPPTIYSVREYAIAGGLTSYGPNLADAYRQAGVYAGRILKARVSSCGAGRLRAPRQS